MKTFSFSISILLAFSIVWDATVVISASRGNMRFNRTIWTNSGPVFGTDISYKGRWVKQYFGIPFAKPPVGELRFSKPQPVERWTKTLFADKMPPACMQYLDDSEYYYPYYDQFAPKSEDCLYLNIWVPTDSDGNIKVMNLATIFWIHGGGFTLGTIRQEIYNGYVLAAEGNLIVVTTNYRLGALGFFTSGTGDAPGNVGMYDILEALKWVYSNIAEFGGNPSQITLAGEGSGSIAVGLLCVSPLAKGLFSGAIMQGGSPAYTFAEDNEANKKLSQRVAKKLGCSIDMQDMEKYPGLIVDCLRGKEAIDIVKALHSLIPRYFLPSYGDEILPINARQALINGAVNPVPILIGANKDAGAFQITNTYSDVFDHYGHEYPQLNKSFAASILRDVFKNFYNAEAIVEHYLGDVVEMEDRSIFQRLAAASGDYTILCPSAYFAESYARAGNDVYFYFFVHRPSNSKWAKYVGVTYFDEVQFVFGKPMIMPQLYNHLEVLLSKRMIHFWSEFAHFGSLDWGTYTRERPQYAELHNEIWDTYGLGPHKESCDFFREYFGFDQMLINYWR